MKFKSKKDTLFGSIIIGVCILVIGLTIAGILNGEMAKDEYWVLPIVFCAVGLLLWIFFGTNYELNNDGLIYRSGPINGKISIDRITEIVKGRTLWMGFRPATSRKGLIVKYDQYNEIYISPKSNESFIEKILDLNSKIIITE